MITTTTADCFIIMPITTPPELVADYEGDAEHYRHVQEHLFTPALLEAGYTPIPPASQGADVIHAEIMTYLAEADLVLCDMSSHNANVFFELGIRTALDLPVCLVTDSRSGPAPFDVGLINYHIYDSSLKPWSLKSEIPSLAAHVKECVRTSGERNPLWRRLGLSIRAALPREANPLEAKIELVLEQIIRLTRSIGSADDPTAKAVEEILRAVPDKQIMEETPSAGRASILVNDVLDEVRRRRGSTDE